MDSKTRGSEQYQEMVKGWGRIQR